MIRVFLAGRACALANTLTRCGLWLMGAPAPGPLVAGGSSGGSAVVDDGRNPARKFLVPVKGPGLKSDRVIVLQLIPDNDEVGFTWLGSGVGWTVTVAELLTMFESTGYVDPFTGQHGPTAPGAKYSIDQDRQPGYVPPEKGPTR